MPVKLFIFLAVFIAVIFQVSLMPNFFSSGSSPDLLLILLVFITVEAGFSRTWKWAILLGLVVDAIFFTLPGTNAISFLTIAFVAELAAKKFLAGQKFWKAFVLSIVIALASVFDSGLAFILARVVNYFYATGYNEYFSLGIIIRSMMYNFILTFILYWPFKRMQNIIISRQELKI